jgi:hypothetical protein
VAILPASTAQAGESTLRVLQIRPRLSSRLELVWSPAASSPAARALQDHARDFMHRPADGRPRAA